MKRLLILAVLAVLLTAGGVGGVYVFAPGLLGLDDGKTIGTPKDPEPKPEPKPEKPHTVPMTTIDIPLVIDSSVNRQIHFTIILVVSSNEATVVVQEALPRLRSAIIQFAYAAFPEQYQKQGRMDLPKLKMSLLRLAQRTVGPDQVQDVLIQSYIEM